MKTYKIEKQNAVSGETRNYGGGYTEQDVEEITSGYKFNGLFYDRKNSNWIYLVEEED